MPKVPFTKESMLTTINRLDGLLSPEKINELKRENEAMSETLTLTVIDKNGGVIADIDLTTGEMFYHDGYSVLINGSRIN